MHAPRQYSYHEQPVFPYFGVTRTWYLEVAIVKLYSTRTATVAVACISASLTGYRIGIGVFDHPIRYDKYRTIYRLSDF